MKTKADYLKKGGIEALLLLAVAVPAGFAVNASRKDTLPAEYKSRDQRLDDSMARLIRSNAAPGAEAPTFVTAEDIIRFTEGDDRILVLDVRPDLFFEDGHIPGAKNLTREGLEKNYPSFSKIISAAPCVIVYCAGTFCEESEKMADALRLLGHRNISVYRGGWEEWSAQGRKIEKE